MNRGEYLTLAGLAEYISASRRTARRLIASGALPTYRLTATGPIRVKLADVETYLETKRREPEQPSLKSLLASISRKVLAERRVSG